MGGVLPGRCARASAPGEALVPGPDTAADAGRSRLTVSHLPDDGVPGRSVLRAVGELDLSTAEALAEQLHRVLAAGADAVVIDLEAVSFVSACGLDVLVSAAENARAGGVSFQVLAAQQRVIRVFELTGTAELVGLRTP